MCGTQALCEADNHLMPIDQAARVLGISKSAVLVAVHRKRIISEGKDHEGKHVFRLEQLLSYKETRRKTKVAHGG